MSVYIFNGDEVNKGILYLNNFLEQEDVNKFDLLIYENITERDIFFDKLIPNDLENISKKLKNKKLIFILSSVPQNYYNLYNYSNIEIIHNPFYFIHFLIKECNIDTWDTYNLQYIDKLKNNKFENLFLILNKRPHYHRCLMMDYLSKNKLLDSSSYTWDSNLKKLESYTFRWWIPIKKSFNTNFDNYNCSDILNGNPAFHLVTESEIEKISFSEKLFKPILSGIPFIVLGGVGFHKKLKEYGFELYDEIFDYSFDDIEEVEDRVMAISETILKLKNKNYREIINTIYDKVQKNRQHALDIYYNKKFIPNEMYNLFNSEIIKFKHIDLQAYARTYEYLF